jgi:anti-sigma factor RsiW
MKCRRIKRMISPYMDDRLGPAEKEGFTLHIQNCASCREGLEETRALHQMFASAQRFSAPYGFATRVLGNIEEMESSRLRRFPGFKSFFLRSAEVAFALAIITIGLVSGSLLLEDRMPGHRQVTVQDSFSLDLFQATPPNSIGGIYLAYVGGTR